MSSMAIQLINLLFGAFNLLVLARVLLSWFNVDPYSSVAQFIYKATEPFLAPIRRMLPGNSPFDFSPMVALIIGMVLQSVLMQMFR